MRSEHLILSLLGLVMGFMLIIVGFLLFLPPFVPFYATLLQKVTSQHLVGLSYFGLTLLFLGVLFLVLLRVLNRRRYLLLKMGGVSVKDSLVTYFAKESLEKLFPGQLVDCDVVIRNKKRIEILANVPYIVEKDRAAAFKTIEKELVAVLSKQCQYDQEFILNVSFYPPLASSHVTA